MDGHEEASEGNVLGGSDDPRGGIVMMMCWVDDTRLDEVQILRLLAQVLGAGKDEGADLDTHSVFRDLRGLHPGERAMDVTKKQQRHQEINSG
jgi:hypothetical protein